MKRSRARKTFAFGSLVAIAVAIIVLWPRGPALRVLDPRMRVISARLLTGTNESFYAGNPLEGHARDFLNRIGIHVETLPDVGKYPARYIGPAETCRFAIYFEWTGTPAPAGISAELVEIPHRDNATQDSGAYASRDVGGVLSLAINEFGDSPTVISTSVANFNAMKHYYLCFAQLDPRRVHQRDFLLRFLRQSDSNGHPDVSDFDAPSNRLAEIVIKRIPLKGDQHK